MCIGLKNQTIHNSMTFPLNHITFADFCNRIQSQHLIVTLKVCILS